MFNFIHPNKHNKQNIFINSQPFAIFTEWSTDSDRVVFFSKWIYKAQIKIWLFFI